MAPGATRRRVSHRPRGKTFGELVVSTLFELSPSYGYAASHGKNCDHGPDYLRDTPRELAGTSPVQSSGGIRVRSGLGEARGRRRRQEQRWKWTRRASTPDRPPE